MAKMNTDQLLDVFKEMTLIELSEFVKAFEETFEVTAAAPVALAAAAPAGGGDAGGAAEQEVNRDPTPMSQMQKGAGKSLIH